MRTITLALILAVPSICQAADLADGWGKLGAIEATIEDESLSLAVLSEPNGNPHAFQMDAGGPKVISIDGHAISEGGTPIWPSLGIDFMTMGPVTVIQEVTFYKSGGSDPEMWMAQEGIGEARFTIMKLSDDGVLTGTLTATLVPWSLSGQTEIAGKPAISLSAEIESTIANK